MNNNISPQLYAYLSESWIRSNQRKYHHLFEEWVNNITKIQIEGFIKMMLVDNVYINK